MKHTSQRSGFTSVGRAARRVGRLRGRHAQHVRGADARRNGAELIGQVRGRRPRESRSSARVGRRVARERIEVGRRDRRRELQRCRVGLPRRHAERLRRGRHQHARSELVLHRHRRRQREAGRLDRAAQQVRGGIRDRRSHRVAPRNLGFCARDCNASVPRRGRPRNLPMRTCSSATPWPACCGTAWVAPPTRSPSRSNTRNGREPARRLASAGPLSELSAASATATSETPKRARQSTSTRRTRTEPRTPHLPANRPQVRARRASSAPAAPRVDFSSEPALLHGGRRMRFRFFHSRQPLLEQGVGLAELPDRLLQARRARSRAAA